jgi:hypothetical protein
MVGLPVDQGAINTTAGDIARQLQHVMIRAGEFKRFLDRFSAADLVVTFGFTLDEANLLKSAYTEAEAVRATHTANRAFLSQIAGMGAV